MMSPDVSYVNTPRKLTDARVMLISLVLSGHPLGRGVWNEYRKKREDRGKWAAEVQNPRIEMFGVCSLRLKMN